MKIIGKIKMFLKTLPTSIKCALILLLVGLGVFFCVYSSRSTEEIQEKIPEPLAKAKKPEFVRGVHLTAWVAGSKKGREKIEALLKETELNTVVIDIKEYEGEVYVPGVPLAQEYKLFVNAIPDLKEYIAQLKAKGIYTIARIVVFKDNLLARKKPELAVKNPDGSLWRDHRKVVWLDPYNKQAWEYILSVASCAVSAGFEEIQFDYIRYPSDGDIKQCRYSFAQHNSSSAVRNLASFLEEASQRLKPLGVNLSIDIFGLTPSVKHDMGIGQKIVELTQWMDFVSPMVYPSHYAKGEYGIPDPNREPYRVVFRTMSDAVKRLGDNSKRLRPYLQDFSLGYKYGPKEVRAQIQACTDAGIQEWLLWNPNCHYTQPALRSKEGILQAVAQLPKAMTGGDTPSGADSRARPPLRMEKEKQKEAPGETVKEKPDRETKESNGLPLSTSTPPTSENQSFENKPAVENSSPTQIPPQQK